MSQCVVTKVGDVELGLYRHGDGVVVYVALRGVCIFCEYVAEPELNANPAQLEFTLAGHPQRGIP
jgi:hypothetical protein